MLVQNGAMLYLDPKATPQNMPSSATATSSTLARCAWNGRVDATSVAPPRPGSMSYVPHGWSHWDVMPALVAGHERTAEAGLPRASLSMANP